MPALGLECLLEGNSGVGHLCNLFTLYYRWIGLLGYFFVCLFVFLKGHIIKKGEIKLALCVFNYYCGLIVLIYCV